MRPRMYGSTDINALQTTISPSAGSATSTSASPKSDGCGSPVGRAASLISRLIIDGNASPLSSSSPTRQAPPVLHRLSPTAGATPFEEQRDRRDGALRHSARPLAAPLARPRLAASQERRWLPQVWSHRMALPLVPASRRNEGRCVAFKDLDAEPLFTGD